MSPAAVIREDGMLVSGLPGEQHDYGMANGHSPVADKVVCIDFDATLVPWGPLMGDKELLPGAAEALLGFQKAGYKVVIWTSRMSQQWAISVVGNDYDLVAEFLADQRRYVTDTILRGAPTFVMGEMTSEKVAAELYIDDKAVHFNGDWREVMDVASARLSKQLWYEAYRTTGRKCHRVIGLPYKNAYGWAIPVACGHDIWPWDYPGDTATPEEYQADLLASGQLRKTPSTTLCGNCKKGAKL